MTQNKKLKEEFARLPVFYSDDEVTHGFQLQELDNFEEILDWINKHYISRESADKIVSLISEYKDMLRGEYLLDVMVELRDSIKQKSNE